MSQLKISDRQSIANLMRADAAPIARWVRRLEIHLARRGVGDHLAVKLRPGALSETGPDDEVAPDAHASPPLAQRPRESGTTPSPPPSGSSP